MSDLFNAAESRALMERGIEIISSFPNDEWVEKAQSVALMIAARKGEVTADDLRAAFKVPPPHPNCFGAVFRSKHLKWTGRMKKSHVKSRHAGLQRVWEYVA